MRVRQFVDEGLGNSAHLVISEKDGVAALIDQEGQRYSFIWLKKTTAHRSQGEGAGKLTWQGRVACLRRFRAHCCSGADRMLKRIPVARRLHQRDLRDTLP